MKKNVKTLECFIEEGIGFINLEIAFFGGEPFFEWNSYSSLSLGQRSKKKQGLYVSTVLKSSQKCNVWVCMLKSNIFYKSFFEGAFLKWPLRLIEGHLHRFLKFL